MSGHVKFIFRVIHFKTDVDQNATGINYAGHKLKTRQTSSVLVITWKFEQLLYVSMFTLLIQKQLHRNESLVWISKWQQTLTPSLQEKHISCILDKCVSNRYSMLIIISLAVYTARVSAHVSLTLYTHKHNLKVYF